MMKRPASARRNSKQPLCKTPRDKFLSTGASSILLHHTQSDYSVMFGLVGVCLELQLALIPACHFMLSDVLRQSLKVKMQTEPDI
jgi:hypothetical protein